MTRLILSHYARYPTLQLVACTFVPDLNSNFSFQPARWHFRARISDQTWADCAILCMFDESSGSRQPLWAGVFCAIRIRIHIYHLAVEVLRHSNEFMQLRLSFALSLTWESARLISDISCHGICICISILYMCMYVSQMYLYLRLSLCKGVYIHEYTYICSGAQLVQLYKGPPIERGWPGQGMGRVNGRQFQAVLLSMSCPINVSSAGGVIAIDVTLCRHQHHRSRTHVCVPICVCLCVCCYVCCAWRLATLLTFL